MFDVGFTEMLLIGVIALLVIGPERLPGLAAKLGRFIKKARAFVATTRSDIEREFQSQELRDLLSKQESEIRELRSIMQSKTDKLQQELRQTESMIDASTRKAVGSMKDAPPKAVAAPTTPDEKS